MNPRALKILKRHRGAWVGSALLAGYLFLAAFIGLFSSFDPDTLVPGNQFKPPSMEHLLGTDDSGRDLFTRLSYAARVSLLIGTASVALAMAIGIPLGAVAGYAGGWTDGILSRIMDVLLAFPSILLAICIAALNERSMTTLITSIGVVAIPQFFRQVRASVLQLREMEFVQAERALGAGHRRILFGIILPNALGPIIVLTTLGIGSSILSAAGLSFLGLGVEAGTAEWGLMLHSGYESFGTSANTAIFSGLAISLAVLAFNLLGDGLRDALDPKTKTH